MHSHYEQTGFNYGSGTSNYQSCKHVNNGYWHPFDKTKGGGNIMIAGSSNFEADPNCDLIINLYTTPVSSYRAPKPLIVCSDNDMADIFKEFNPAAPKRLVKKPKTITIDWPDYGVPIPQLEAPFWHRLFEYVSALPVVDGSDCIEVLFTCMGGNGRTGTAMCCFLMGSGAYDPLSAIKYVRSQYCAKAVESSKQEQYIWDVGEWFLKEEGHDPHVIVKLFDQYKDWVDKSCSSRNKSGKGVTETTVFPKSGDKPPKDAKTAALLGYADPYKKNKDNPALDAFTGMWEL